MQLQRRYRTGRILGARVCSASLFRAEKSIWEHYNNFAAKLDATQEKEWHDMASTILIFVRRPSSLSMLSPASKVYVVGSFWSRPFSLYELQSPKRNA